MAIIEPNLVGVDQSNRFANDEISTVEILAEMLPDNCTIFHSMEWVKLRNNEAFFGEIDLCIVGPSGITVTIEQKNGTLKQKTNGNIYKQYKGGKISYPAKQLAKSRNSLIAIWNSAFKQHSLELIPLIYLPDYIVKESPTPVDKGLIIDEKRKHELPKIVSHLLQLNTCQPDKEHKDRVVQFFRNQFMVMPSVGAIFSHQIHFYTKKQNELTRFIKAMSFSPPYLLIEGGAGSGKTQIAVELFHEILRAGKRPLLLCYNRPLAKDLEVLADGTNGVIANVDKFANDFMKTRAIYDLSEEYSGDIFSKLKTLALSQEVEQDWQFDSLIIDEAQDFTEENYKFACFFLKPNSQIIVLKDNQQNLYRHGFDFTPTVSLKLDQNYRNADEVIAFTDALLKKNYRKTADSLTFDIDPSIESYHGEQGYLAQLIKKINYYLDMGFSLADMVIIVGCGQGKSWLMKQRQIGSWKIKRFSGEYSAEGDQLYTDGALLVDTVYRFKGRQKPIVFFTEIDFAKWSESIEKLLYVGCTRAEITCSLFITARSEQVFIEQHSQSNTEVHG